jgi:hypothetical protein
MQMSLARGGLIVAQFFTLCTTPLIYVLMDGLRRRNPRPTHFAAGAERGH